MNFPISFAFSSASSFFFENFLINSKIINLLGSMLTEIYVYLERAIENIAIHDIMY